MRGVIARYSLFPVPYSLVVLLLAAACGDEDRTQTEFTASIDKTSTSADDTAAVPARAVPVPDTAEQPAPSQVTVALALAPLGRATVRGSGEARAVGKATSVSVALSRGIAGVTYEGAIRQGGCRAMGPNVASLYPVSADSLGSGRVSSDVHVPIDSLTAKPHVIIYGRGGRPETCAPIGPPSTTPPPPARPDVINVPYADTMRVG
ncbi:hypothetical protein [Longimicrobium sp.]|uniref:hypothetical protein n=1 Tax=Longimicrobium sp. TaxID=2029185 RepID=UPI003B3AC7B1